MKYKESAKVGDRVKLISSINRYAVPIGSLGTIKYLNEYHCDVEFDEAFLGGYTCGDHCQAGHGVQVYYESLENVSKNVVQRKRYLKVNQDF